MGAGGARGRSRSVEAKWDNDSTHLVQVVTSTPTMSAEVAFLCGDAVFADLATRPPPLCSSTTLIDTVVRAAAEHFAKNLVDTDRHLGRRRSRGGTARLPWPPSTATRAISSAPTALAGLAAIGP